jgi:uncharacterized protein (UPF0261 family)
MKHHTREKRIICLATLDTKGNEILYIKNILQARGHRPIVIDCGTFGEPSIVPDIPREQILQGAGSSFEEVRAAGSARRASEIMMIGLRKTIKDLCDSGQIDGMIAIGGSMGSSMASAAMKDLPLGLPKLLVSTKVAQAGAQEYVGTKDIMIMPSVADIQGLNRLTRRILKNAAGAICGMVEMEETVPLSRTDNRTVVMSMVGGTHPCGVRVQSALEEKGYEVVIFHAIGVGGKALEEFVENEAVVGTIELGINEVGNDLFGGLATSGPNRLEAAGMKDILQIITPGHSGYIQFLGPDTIPTKYKDRDIIHHSPQGTAVLLTRDELKVLAGRIADKLNRAAGVVRVLIPLRGFSAWDKEGERYYDPEKNHLFIEHLEKGLKPSISVRKIDVHINDVQFSDAVIKEFLQSMR